MTVSMQEDGLLYIVAEGKKEPLVSIAVLNHPRFILGIDTVRGRYSVAIDIVPGMSQGDTDSDGPETPILTSLEFRDSECGFIDDRIGCRGRHV